MSKQELVYLAVT